MIDPATINPITVEQIKIWQAKRDQLGVTDAELLRHILPMLDQIKLKEVA